MTNYAIKYALIMQDKMSAVMHKVNKSILAVENNTRNASKRLEKFGARMSKISHRMVLPVTELTLALHAGVHAADEQITALRIMKNSLGGNVPTLKKIVALTTQLQETTRFDQASVMAGAEKIASMTKSPEVTLLGLKAVADFATHRGWKDYMRAALLVSHSMEAGNNALSQYGINFDNTLTGYKRAIAIYKAIEHVAGGQALIAGKQGSGPLIRLKNEIGSAWKDIAMTLFSTFNPMFERLIKQVIRFQHWLSKHKKVAKAIAIIITSITALSIAILAMATLITGVSMIMRVFSGSFGIILEVIMTLLNPIKTLRLGIMAVGVALRFATGPLGIILTVLSLLVGKFALSSLSSDNFSGHIDKLGASAKSSASGLQVLWDKLTLISGWFEQQGKKLGGWVGKLLKHLNPKLYYTLSHHVRLIDDKKSPFGYQSFLQDKKIEDNMAMYARSQGQQNINIHLHGHDDIISMISHVTSDNGAVNLLGKMANTGN